MGKRMKQSLMDEIGDSPGYMEQVGSEKETPTLENTCPSSVRNQLEHEINPVPGHTQEEEEDEDYSNSPPKLSNIHEPPGCARLLHQQQPEQDIPAESISVDDEESSMEEQRNLDAVQVENEPLPMSYSTISGLILCSGTKRFSRREYNVCRMFVNHKTDDGKCRLPSASTIQKKIQRIADRVCFVQSTTLSFPVNLDKSGARGGVARYASTSSAPVEIVLPSEWAKLDLSTNVCASLFNTSGLVSDCTDRAMFSTIEECPLVRDRELFISPFSMRTSGMKRCILGKGTQLLVTFHKRRISKPEGLFLHESGLDMASVEDEVNEVMMVQGMCVTGMEPLNPHILNCESATICSRVQEECAPGDILLHMKTSDNESIYKFVIFSHIPSNNRVSLLVVNEGNIVRIQAAVRLTEDQKDTTLFQPKRNAAPCYGRLADGSQYFVYRFLLYSDGFTPTLGNKGSVCGCYMLPLGIPVENRTIGGSVRRIALAPPGVSPNLITEKIVDDIKTGITEGFQIKQLNGDPIRIFLDPVGNIGDYPAITEAIDVLGHNANAPCTICSFVRRAGENYSRYSYTATIHSGHLSFRRSGLRNQHLRNSSNINNDDMNSIGLLPNSRLSGRSQPLHKLMSLYTDVRGEIPKTESGEPVVPPFFDAYLSNVIAPDHLFSGLAKHALDAIAVQLAPTERTFLSNIMILLLSENGMAKVHKVIGDSETVTLTMSELFDILLISRPALQILQNHFDLDARPGLKLCVDNLILLSELVASTRFHPAMNVDGPCEIKKFNKDFGRDRFHKLHNTAVKYINGISDICTSQVSDKVKKLLDRPIVHRLMEFYETTLPAFGNVRLIEELILERAHQEAKKGIMSSNFQNPQLQAMMHIRANDWINRVGYEMGNVKRNGTGWDENSLRSILRLMGDPRWDRPLFENDVSDVQTTFQEPLMQLIQERAEVMDANMHCRRKWLPNKHNTMSLDDVLCNTHSQFRTSVEQTVSHIGGIGSVQLLESLNYVSTSESNSSTRLLREVRVGHVVQSRLTTSRNEVERESSFIVILSFAKSMLGNQLYVIGLRMQHVFGNRYRIGTRSTVHVLLSRAVPVFSTHPCTKGSHCITRNSSGKVTARHCPHVSPDTVLLVLGKQDGYPSRNA